MRKTSSLAFASAAAVCLSSAVIAPTSAAAQDHIKSLGPAPRAPVIASPCTTTATRVKVSKTAESTTSTTYVDLADMFLAFPQGGTVASCVLVQFSSESKTAANETMRIEAILDGSTHCQPDDNVFASNETLRGVRAMTYVCPSVAPGTHSVKIHYRSTGGTLVQLDYRTLVVMYAK
jgi:hypothetical protein